MFRIGDAIVTRIEETYGITRSLADTFPEMTRDQFAEHRHWLAPHHYDAAQDLIKLSVHSWLLQVGGKKILIDCCCGNHKSKPQRPQWHMLNVPFLEKLEAAGARADEIDLVMCTHLHHDHIGWNTMHKNGKWVPTFPNARYVFSKPEVETFARLDADPDHGAVEFGTFRECVIPILEYGRADLVDGEGFRLNDFLEIGLAPGHSPGHVIFRLESKGAKAIFTGDVWHHQLQVYYPDWNFPKNFREDEARVSRCKVLAECAASGALVFPGHVGWPHVGHIEKIANGFRSLGP